MMLVAVAINKTWSIAFICTWAIRKIRARAVFTDAQSFPRYRICRRLVHFKRATGEGLPAICDSFQRRFEGWSFQGSPAVKG